MDFGILSINNFGTIRQLKIDLSKPILHQLKGWNQDVGQSNETGKSTIFNALTWCLYGLYPAVNGKIGDGVVNPSVGNNCLVETPIIKSDRIVYVSRTRKHEIYKNQLFIKTKFTDGNEEEEIFDLGLKNNDASNKAIENIIGMDYQTFLRSHYFAQTGIEPFGLMTDRELKEFFLNKLLDLSWIKSAHESAKKDLNDKEKELQIEEISLENNKAKLIEIESRIEDYKIKEEEWLGNKKIKVDSLKEEINDFYKQKQMIVDKEEEIKKKIKEIHLEMSMLTDGMDWDAVISKIDGKKRPIINNMAKYKNIIESFPTQKEMKVKLNEINDKIGENCSECGSVITKDHLPHLKSFLLSELRNQNKKRRELKPLLISAENELKSLDLEVKAINTKKERNAEKSADYRESKAKLQSLLDVTDVSKIERDILRGEKDLVKLESEISQFTEMIKKEENDLMNTNKDVSEKNINIDSLEKEIININFWIKAFSSQGIQSFVLDGVTQIINRYIAGYMMSLSDGRIQASLNTVNRLKSGEYREKFKLNINNMDGGSFYASLSGGARKRVDIATSLAISDFKRSLSGSELKFLVFDESTSGMDSFWQNRFIEMILEKFRGYSTWFISHQDIEPYYFDETITVTKKNGITMLMEEEI